MHRDTGRESEAKADKPCRSTSHQPNGTNDNSPPLDGPACQFPADATVQFFALSLHPFLIADLDGTIRQANPAWTEILGFEVDEMVGTSFFELVHPDDLEQTRRETAQLGQGIDTKYFENRYRCRTGEYRCLAWSATTATPSSGPIYATAQDITERKRAEDEARYRAAIENALIEISTDLLNSSSKELDAAIDRAMENIGLCFRADRSYLFLLVEDGQRISNTHEWCAPGIEPQLADLQGIGTDTFPAWMTTLRRREVIEIPCVEQLSSDWDNERRSLSEQGIKSLLVVPVVFAEHLFGCTGFDSVEKQRDWTENEVRVLRFLGNLIGGALGRKRAEEALQQSQDQLERIAYYDPLTGLPNRRLVLDRIRQSTAIADRNGTLMAVCYLDLDGFKPVNDKHGHEAGDELLISVSHRLTSGVRAGDTVARWGGDEFAILLNGLENMETCDEVLERLLKLVSKPHAIRDRTFKVTASIGVTVYPEDLADSDTLLRHADQAMYLSKQGGRNTYHFFDPEEERRAAEYRTLLLRIADAFEAQELCLRYQPIVNMHKGVVEGAEALVRWNHPQRGLLAPSEFLHAVEGHDLHQKLEYWVIRRALDQLARWIHVGLSLRLSVNISARTLLQTGFIPHLEMLLKSFPSVDPATLVLEVMETDALEDHETVASTMHRGAKLGLSFALDDFGTGYSSLTYLRRLPAGMVKIDQTFVRDMLQDREDLSIVEGVIGLARAFERRIIAEGVESIDRGSMLLRLGCELGQGFGIARPMSAEALHAWVGSYVQPADWVSVGLSTWSPEEMQLLSMEAEHRTWVARVVSVLSGDGDWDSIELDPSKCRFGHWYETAGKRKYGHLPSFAALGPLHQRVHELVKEMADAHNRGDPSAIKRIGELFAARDCMIAALCVLQSEVAAERCQRNS